MANLTLTSAAYDTTGAKFGAAALSGGYGIATLPANKALPCTFECWFKAPSAPGATKGIGGDNGMLQMRIAASGALGTAGFGGTTNAQTDATNRCDGAWHHVAWVMTAAGVAAFCDGVQVTTVTGTPTFTASNQLGVRDFAGNTGFAFGEVDEFAYFPFAKYTPDFSAFTAGNFTPPTAPYSGNEGMSGLYHLDSNGADSTVPTVIAANDAKITYSPYDWLVSSAVAKAANNGSYLSCAFSGSQATLNFDTTQGSGGQQIEWRVDGGPWTRSSAASVVCAPAADTASWPHHFLEVIYKSVPQTGFTVWATQQTQLYLNNITLDSGAALVAPPARNAKKIVVFGDSIVQGVTDVNGTDGTNPNRMSARLSYAFQLRDKLGVDLAMVGWGGQGWMRPPGAAAGSTTVGDIPAFPASWNLLWSGQARDFSTPPDLAIINHGTNDATYTDAQVTAAVTSTLQAMLAAGFPQIAVMRPFNGSKWSAIQAGVAAVGSSNVTTIDTTGWFNTVDSVDGLHPYGVANLGALADLHATAVRPLLYGPPNATTVGSVGDTDTVNLVRSGAVVQTTALALKNYLKAA